MPAPTLRHLARGIGHVVWKWGGGASKAACVLTLVCSGTTSSSQGATGSLTSGKTKQPLPFGSRTRKERAREREKLSPCPPHASPASVSNNHPRFSEWARRVTHRQDTPREGGMSYIIGNVLVDCCYVTPYCTVHHNIIYTSSPSPWRQGWDQNRPGPKLWLVMGPKRPNVTWYGGSLLVGKVMEPGIDGIQLSVTSGHLRKVCVIRDMWCVRARERVTKQFSNYVLVRCQGSGYSSHPPN